jgi:hypothetical protein
VRKEIRCERAIVDVFEGCCPETLKDFCTDEVDSRLTAMLRDRTTPYSRKLASLTRSERASSPNLRRLLTGIRRG